MRILPVAFFLLVSNAEFIIFSNFVWPHIFKIPVSLIHNHISLCVEKEVTDLKWLLHCGVIQNFLPCAYGISDVSELLWHLLLLMSLSFKNIQFLYQKSISGVRVKWWKWVQDANKFPVGYNHQILPKGYLPTAFWGWGGKSEWEGRWKTNFGRLKV